ncbi:MoaD/ThiS family protein [Urbifossiella limnaea]|uniref:Molybdopterin synthase sulfur carrier subunit n=1 Tax=Urbifossiella limnaea TaxID=2528023 RepID=A0A517XZL3_9BACT|nr:MoaD/ThiS family protein [Urbifossiella limnaea]QDU22952.1 molybdopterin synthase small subunit [Urbifossiella limnaea]
MTLTVHLFAAARDLAGAAALPIDLPDRSTVSDLRAALAACVPALAALLARSAVAVDHEFADDTHVLTATAEVAVLPPVSGG